MKKRKTYFADKIGLKIETKHLLNLLGFYSLVALIAAYVAQYIFGHQPCVLCYYQRLPFFVVVVISLASLLFFKKKKSQKLALIFCIILLLGNAVLAAYHVGVEQKIFAGPSTCADISDLDQIENVEDLAAAISKTKAVKCDTPSFVFLSLSMAAWNVIYCLFLSLPAIFLLRKSKK
jgi:disulfide bond formation protein DsbB